MHKKIIVDANEGSCTSLMLCCLLHIISTIYYIGFLLGIDPDDYTGVTTVVTFPAGQTTQTVDVPTIDDNDSEGTESFTATLSNASPSDVVFITEDTATINITDNDSKL